MRLNDIYQTLTDAIPRLEIQQKAVGKNVEVTSFREAIVAATEIRATGVLDRDADALLNVKEIVRHAEDTVIVSGETFNTFNNALERLKARAGWLMDGLTGVLQKEQLEEIAVKLPDTEDLDALAESVRDLSKMLNQAVVNEYVNGQVKLKGVDRGSTWLLVWLGSKAAMALIGRICSFIYDFQMKQLDVAKHRQELRLMTSKADAVEAFEKVLEAELEDWREERIREIAASTGAPASATEFQQRVKFVAQEMAQLVERGGEVRAPMRLSKTKDAPAFPPKGVLRKLTDGGRVAEKALPSEAGSPRGGDSAV